MDVARVVVAEDDLLIRELIAAFIDMRRDLDLVGQAGNGADGARLVAALRPDWLITDYELGDMVADELVAAVRQCAPSTAVLLHTGRPDGQALAERLQVNLYAPKTAALEPLQRALALLCGLAGRRDAHAQPSPGEAG